jgi:hypothetical protein
MTIEEFQEFAKCKSDPVYFINTYCKIEHPKFGKIPFKLYGFQEDIIHQLQTNKLVISNKSRQTGLSTITAAYALWMGMFHENRNIVILSIRDQDAQSFLKKVKVAFHELPDWLKDEPTTDNAHELSLTTGSSIRSVASGAQAARGQALSLLILDEAAFVDKISTIWKAAYPTLSRGGSAVLISTPNGIGNFFYNTWMNSQPEAPPDRKNGFTPIFVHWTDIPEYRGFDDVTGMSRQEIINKAIEVSEWYKEMRPQFTDKEWAQEFEGDFLGSGKTVIDPNILKEVEPELAEPIRKSKDGSLWVWQEPQPGNYYIIGADVASGSGSDYSTFHVLDLVTGEQVAEYQGLINIVDYASYLDEIGRYYNDAYLVVEKTGLGVGVVHKLAYDLNYENLHNTVSENNQKVKRREYGWNTTMKTRPLLISSLEKYINSREFKWKSKRLWNELTSFVWKTNTKAEADGDNNDDLVLAYSIAAYNRDSAIRQLPSEFQHALYSTDDGLPTDIAGLSDEGELYDPYTLEPTSIHEIRNRSDNNSNFDPENEEDITKWLTS